MEKALLPAEAALGEEAEKASGQVRPAPSPPAAFLYTDEYLKFDYGVNHPLKVSRLGLTRELIGLCGLGPEPAPFEPATRAELLTAHGVYYLDTLEDLSRERPKLGLERYGLGHSDNPVFPGLYEFAALLAGGSLSAARLVAQKKFGTAFSPAGGMHHALPGRAAGFCYVNDPVIAIKELLAKAERVAYVDIDAHHGDGVQWAFYDTPRVLTISMHQHPATLFPGTGFVEENGRGEGKGYSLNLPLWPDTDDDLYIKCFEEVVRPALEAFKPDYIVTQLGTDSLLGDPLANLNLTTAGFGHCLKAFREMARDKWVALGGGGYHPVNSARAWALAWAVMLGREAELPQRLPEEFCARHNIRGEERWLLDPEEKLRGRHYPRARRNVEEVLDHIKTHFFPILGAMRA